MSWYMAVIVRGSFTERGYQPWEVPEEEEDLGEVTELGEIEEPGADRFRPQTG